MIIVDLLFFLLELFSLAAFCYWGFNLEGADLLTRVLVGIGTPVMVAILWGTFISPKASIPVPVPLRFILQLSVFGSAAAVLYASGLHKLAAVFLIVAFTELVLTYTLRPYSLK